MVQGQATFTPAACRMAAVSPEIQFLQLNFRAEVIEGRQQPVSGAWQGGRRLCALSGMLNDDADIKLIGNPEPS